MYGSRPSRECSGHSSVKPLREIVTSFPQTPQMNTCASKSSHGHSSTSQAQTSTDFTVPVDSSKACTEISTSATTLSWTQATREHSRADLRQVSIGSPIVADANLATTSSRIRPQSTLQTDDLWHELALRMYRDTYSCARMVIIGYDLSSRGVSEFTHMNDGTHPYP